MSMRLSSLPRMSLAGLAVAAVLPFVAPATAQDLDSFAVLGGSTVTNTGSSVIGGNVGVSPGGAIVGFPPGIVTPPFTFHANDAVAAQAQMDLVTEFVSKQGESPDQDLTNQDLGGLTLTPGVYNFDTAAELNGTLRLDAQGDPNAIFIFNIGSTLTTGSNSAVLLQNMAYGGNVFFVVGSSATLGTDTDFAGKILALTSITLNTAATINCGAALARNGAVTLDTNTIGICVLDAGTFDDGLEDEDTTDNAQAVADALDAFVEGGGVLPPGFAILAGMLTPAELADALAQLAGETGTGVAPTIGQSMDSFLTLVMGGGRSGTPLGGGYSDGVYPQRGTPQRGGSVSVMGYAPDKSPARPAFEAFDAGHGVSPLAEWEAWMAAFGGISIVDNDVGSGAHGRTSRDFGLAVGLETISADSVFGFAIATGGTDFALNEDMGSGRSTMVQAAIHGRAEFEQAYVAGALAYGIHAVDTERTLDFAGVEHLSASFHAHNVGGQIEAGYRLGALTPYAALRAQAIYTPAYMESSDFGTSGYALAYDEAIIITARSEVGARVGWSTVLAGGAVLGLDARAAWVHDFGDDAGVSASFVAVPGVGFVVNGARPDADSALLSAGARVSMANGFFVAGSMEGEFAANAQSYAGTFKLGYSW